METTRKRLLIPTLMFIPGVLLLIGLGLWQVERLFEKRALIHEVESRIASDPLVLPEDFSNIEQLQYRRTAIAGDFLYDKTLHLEGQYFKGQLGLRLLTPMRLVDGRVILVDRGWVSREMKQHDKIRELQQEGPVRREGILRTDWRPNFMTPENDIANNYWFTVNVADAARATGLPLLPMYVELLDSPNAYPLTGKPQIKLRNDHLQYAITWFSLAIAFTVIFVLWRRKEA